MIICPNFNNPDVTREFNELKDAVGEKAAYAIWSLNNGNAIDKAPNGAESKLFLDLLLHFDGNRAKAIRAKAKTYGASFMRWFGDWTGNYSEKLFDTKKLFNSDNQGVVPQLVQQLQAVLAPLGNLVHGLADMQKYLQEHNGILNGETQLSIDWITIPPIPAGSSLYKELSEADKAQQKTVEELNRINKLLHGQEIYESSMQTADGEIKIDQSTSDKEEDKIWISCGKSIYGKVTLSIVANANKNLIGGSVILPAKQLTKEDTNYERLDNPIRINHAGILKAVLSHFINAGHKRPASKWLWYAGDYGYKRNVEALSKMLGIDVSPYFQYELSRPIDTVDRNGKPAKSYKERVVVDAEGLLRALPTLLDTKQYNEILKAIEFNEQDNTSYELQRKALADQYKTLSEKNEKLLDEIQRIKKEIQRESYKMYDLPFFLTPNGEIYGFVAQNGDIYLDETKISSEHPIHEYTHLWDGIVAKKNPKLWERGIQLMRQTSLWKQIENDPNYGQRWKAIQNITYYKLESLIASEVHARLVGKGGQRLLDNLAKEKGAESIIDKLKLWILDFWKDLKATFSDFSDEEIQKLTLKDFNRMTLRDFVDAERLGKDKKLLHLYNASTSKVVDHNGEPLIIYHYSDDESLTKFSTDFDNYFSLTGGTKKAIFFTEDNPSAEERDNNFITKRSNKIAVFLNIKDLKVYKGTKEDLHKQGTSYREVVNKSAEENDVDGGLHMEDFDDNKKEHQSIWIVHSPNQIKSIENDGSFTNGDDIYYNILSQSEYTGLVNELELQTEDTDEFLANFMKKVLLVDPKNKFDNVDYGSNWRILNGTEFDAHRANERINRLAAQIFGYPVELNVFDSKEEFIKSVNKTIENWRKSLLDVVNSESSNDNLLSLYREKRYLLNVIQSLLSYLWHDLNLDELSQSQKEIINKISSKKDISTKRQVGYEIQKSKKLLVSTNELIKHSNFGKYRRLVSAKNRIIATSVIENIEDLVHKRLLLEYDSFNAPKNIANAATSVKPLFTALDKAIKNKDVDNIGFVPFKFKEKRPITFQEFESAILKYNDNFKDLLSLFKSATHGLKIYVGGDAETQLTGIVPGKFSPKNNELWLSNIADIHTCIHELAHAATYYGMMLQTEDITPLSSKIETFIEYIRNYIREQKLDVGQMRPFYNFPADVYGFTNASEFIAEMYGNPDFLEVLELIPPMQNKEFKSLFLEIWSKIVDFLNSVFGKKKISKSALDLAKILGEACIRMQQQHISDIKTIISLLKNDIQQDDQNNVLLNMSYKNIFYHLKDLATDYVINNRLMTLKAFNSMYGTNLQYTDSKRHGVWAKNPKLWGIDVSDNSYDPTAVKPRYLIDQISLRSYLQEKFGIKIKVVSDEYYNRVISESSYSWCGIRGDTMYIRESRNGMISNELYIEEFLHPMIHLLYSANKQLSSKLIALAKRDFPLLCEQIQKMYEDRGLDVINEEIITQVLSKYLNKELSISGTNSHDLINYISKIVEKIFLEFKDLFGNVDVKSVQKSNKILISGKDITDVLSYSQLAELINSKLAIFRDVLGEDEKMLNMLNGSQANNQEQSSITRLLYSLGEQIDLKRQQYITAVVDLYKKNNPDAQQDLIAKVYNESRKQFNLQQSDAILRDNLLKLATSFGLHMNADGYFESSETGLKKLMLEHFINSLQQSTSKTYRLSNIAKPKYQQVGHVLNATSFANVIYSALYDGELATLDKQMARDYVRMFWGSDLIQSALDALHTNNQNSLLLEDRLVERMTKEPVQSRPQAVEWFNNIWNRLKDIVKTVFGAHSFTEEEKNDIINAATAAYMVSQDLEYTENNNVIYDRIDGDYSSSDLLSEQDKKILSNIKLGILTRIKSQHARSIAKLNLRLIADLKSSLELIDSKNEDSVEDVFDIIERFLKTANLEIMQTRHYIDNNLILKPKSEWDAQVVNQILQDLIGYYLNLLMQVYSLFSDRTSAINKYNQYRVENNEDAIDLKNFVSQLVKDISGLLQDYNSHVVMPYVKMVLTDYVNLEDAISDKQTFLYNMYKFLEQDSAYGDLAAGEVLVGMASRSKSSVVRIVEKMMRLAESAASRLVLKKGHDLMRLYDKVRPIGSQISPINWQKRFMEFDRDGIPTRYFVREINYGQFYKDKDEKERLLRAKYGLIVDENGDTVFPENEETTKDDSVYNKYYDELDEWLDKHCERRYKLLYYKDRRRHLSPKTIRALQLVLRQINLLLDKCRVNDEFVDLSKLTQNERVQLRDLRKRKRDLGSYYTFTDIGGILHVEEKTGDALQIAKEITAWNKYVNGKVNYNPDWNAFNAAKRTIEELYGKDSEEVRNFVRSNTIKRITPEFYNLLKLAIGVGATSKRLEELKARHRLIINALKLNVGYSSQNLSKLGLGLNTDRSGWIELQKIEQEMANEKRRLKSAGVKGEKPTDAESLTFEQIARMMPVTVGDRSTKTYLSYLQEQWRAAAASNTDLLNIFNSMFTYTDEKGRTTFLKAFLYLSPKDAEVTVNGRKYNCIETIPGSEYSELDEHSSFVNERFDKNGPSLLAKAVDENGNSLYKSEEYEKLTDNEKQFLNALLQTMGEAWEMIPKTANREYKLPLVSGRTMTVLSNTLRCQEWQTAIGYTLRKFGTTYAETTDDVSTNADLARRPDGSVVNNIPIRFINDLDNPIVLSTDVLGSVMMFYDMACNYHYKSQNLPTLELIKYAVRPQLSGTNQMKDQYSKIENLLDQRYYGKETSFGFDSNEKITPAKLRTIQTTKTIRNLAAVAMLGVNFTTIEVGYADAMISVLCESIAGKYITVEDATWAFGQCVVHTKNALKNLGKPVVDDKLVAAMQYNQLSRSNSEIFSMTDMNKASRFVHQHLLMGGYTLSDYMVNGLVLLATYHHYRLIEDPTKGKKRFFSKSDAINTFTKLGYSEKEAIRLWKKADVTLWDAYDSKKGDFVVKDEYKDIVTKALEDRIMGRVTDRTAMYNGVIPQAEKAKLLQNVFGSFITLMRNFYINTYWDRFKTGGDYVAKDGDHTITWRSEYARDDLGMVNLETGEFEGAVFKDFVRGLYKMTKNVANFIRGGSITKLTGEQRYALVRLTSELVIVGLLGFWMVWSWLFARENDYDDDKENAWTLELFGENKGLHFKTVNMDEKFFNWMRWKMALLSTRTFTERLTPWTPQVAIELFTSPSTATSYLDDIGLFWGLFIDLINGDVDKEIKNGGYKHTSRGTRDILKLFSFTGIDNIVRSWHEDGIKSTANYYRKLSPTTLFIPSQELWNEEHGLGSHGASGGSSSSGFLEFE